MPPDPAQHEPAEVAQTDPDRWCKRCTSIMFGTPPNSICKRCPGREVILNKAGAPVVTGRPYQERYLVIDDVRLSDFGFEGDPTFAEIIQEFADSMARIPSVDMMALVQKWDREVDPKLMLLVMYAGARWALAHPERVQITEV